MYTFLSLSLQGWSSAQTQIFLDSLLEATSAAEEAEDEDTGLPFEEALLKSMDQVWWVDRWVGK